MFKLFSRLSLFFILSIIVFSGCDKDSTSSKKSFTPDSGRWSGSGISFTVGGDPLSVSSIRFTYSGYASGSYCSFSYTSTTSLSASMEIDGKSFSYNSSSYTIEGTFITETTAEIDISWSQYDSYCRASYSGSKSYSASYASSTTAMNKNASSESDDGSEICEIITEDSQTIIKKQYDVQ
ncbi:hypothetical protein JW835_12360 [bacterium]|nr:hypothetical protein [bacterium]